MAHTVQTARIWSTDQTPTAVVSPVSAPGRVDLRTSADPDAVGDGQHWSPTELLAAALSGCLLHATLDVAGRSKVELRGWQDRVTLTLDRTDGPTVRVVRATVEVTVQVAGSPRPDRVERIVHKAHRLCTIAGSLAAPVTVHVEVRSNA
jgi:organic hydroperoxide reductase OsmC/OhrA